jgi:hypothetical protein
MARMSSGYPDQDSLWSCLVCPPEFWVTAVSFKIIGYLFIIHNDFPIPFDVIEHLQLKRRR